MAVKLRLSRIGKKKTPFYRIVAIDGRRKRDGQCLENLGTYNAMTSEIVQFHGERLQEWISKGALPSDTVRRIMRQHKRGDINPSAVALESVPAKKVEAKPAVDAAVKPKTEAAPVAEAKKPEAPKSAEKADEKAKA